MSCVIWSPDSPDLKIPNGINKGSIYRLTSISEFTFIELSNGEIVSDLTGFKFVRDYFIKKGLVSGSMALLENTYEPSDRRSRLDKGNLVKIIHTFDDGDVKIESNGFEYNLYHTNLISVFDNRNNIIDYILD